MLYMLYMLCMGVGHGVIFCDRGGGSAERYVTPKII